MNKNDLNNKNSKSQNFSINFIDLFAGIGGIRAGFEQACAEAGFKTKCVLTSEIKEHAIEILKQNHPYEKIEGDITKINADDIPDFEFLLAGFPCQAFSVAGKRLGFMDIRGTMFFEVARILKTKQPFGFILENVEGLIAHNKKNKNDKIGQTFSTILLHLENLGYKVSWKILNARNFGLPQDRKRVYIVGTKTQAPHLENFKFLTKNLSSILEKGLETSSSSFVENLLNHFSVSELYGKAIKDKRGGTQNIHSWDIELKGKVTSAQKQLLNVMLKERRKKKWAIEYGIEWMDGMPLTYEQIKSFYNNKNLDKMLEDLVKKGYIKKEHPKKKVNNLRIQDSTLPIGYNIVTGKMSFEVNKILNPNDIAPTLVAMDMKGLFVPDINGIRNLSLKEGLRLFGYPENFRFTIKKDLGYDLLGNTVAVPVIKAVANRLIDIYKEDGIIETKFARNIK